MGMSASQARFLILTAQKSNNEYQAQRITHERLMLAQETAGKVSRRIAAPGHAQDQQDKIDGVVAVLFHGKEVLEVDQ